MKSELVFFPYYWQYVQNLHKGEENRAPLFSWSFNSYFSWLSFRAPISRTMSVFVVRSKMPNSDLKRTGFIPFIECHLGAATSSDLVVSFTFSLSEGATRH